MYKVVIIGGGWSGCAAALAARKAGAEVTLLEKTDMLLGLGNVGGIMRNNGRFTAAEENIALGARELFDITDRCSRHVNIDFPGHKHASLYDVMKVEPNVRRLLREKGVDVRLMARAVDVVLQKSGHGACGSGDRDRRSGGIGHSGETRRSNTGCGEVHSVGNGYDSGVTEHPDKTRRSNTEPFDNGDMQDAAIEKLILAGNPAGIGGDTEQTIEGDVFVETTGSTGPMGNCLTYGNGCCMCVLRCPAFGPRVSISARAGGSDIMGRRRDGSFGAFSGSGKLEKGSLSAEIQKKLNEEGVSAAEAPVKPADLAGLLQLIAKGTISGKIAKKVLPEMWKTGKSADVVVKEQGLVQITDTGALEDMVKKIIAANPQSVADYKAGKKKAIGFLVGQIMKETKGRANPGVVNQLLTKNLQ